MAWSGTIVATRDNPVPNGNFEIDVLFSDGTTSFTKTYQLEAGNYSSTADVDAFVAQQAATFETMQNIQADLPGAVVTATPSRVTNYQSRATLVQDGTFDAVDAMVKQYPVASTEYQAWEYANYLYRDSSLAAAIAAELGYDDAGLDQFFIRASQVSV